MTTEEIYNVIAEEKDNTASLAALTPANDTADSLLSDVNTKSKVGIWRLFAWLISYGHYLQWNRFTTYKAEVTTIALSTAVPNTEWHIARALEFQYGDTYEIINGRPTYAVIDASKQIIKRAAIVKQPFGCLLKVAKEVSGVVTALTSTELTAFKSYVDDFAPPGSTIESLSQQPDLMQLKIKLYYKAIHPEATVKQSCIDNILAYNKSLDFKRGVVKRVAMQDAIQKTLGFDDMEFEVFKCKPNTGDYVDVTREYVTNAGYIDIDGAFPLSTNITMVPVI